MAYNEEKYNRLKKQQADKEEQLITGKERLFGIYQLKHDLPNLHELAYQGTKALEKIGDKIDADNYELLYVDSLDGADLNMKGSLLEDIYYRFNMERPEDYVGHSLSVSDVVVLQHEGELEAFFCDSFGFSEEPEFAEKLKEKFSDIEAFKNSIFVELTGHNLDGKKAEDVKSLRFDFEDIINTINDDREKYNSAIEDITLSTIYGDVKLSSVTRDEYDRFALPNDYYIGKLSADNGLMNEEQTVAFNKYEILGVNISAPDTLISENTSLVNPAYNEMIMELLNNKENVTFTCYQTGDKQGYEVTFFKDEDVSRFYVTDTDEYGIANGVGVVSEDFVFDEGMALMLLQELNMGFDNLDNCIVFRLHDKEMTERLIEQSKDAPLPVELRMSVIDDGMAGVEKTLFFCDALTARSYSENVKNELSKDAEISGIDRQVQIDIHNMSYSAISEQKGKQDNNKDYKPLAKIEETEEQNYNMIDNVINNTESKDEKEKRQRGNKYADFKIRKRIDDERYDLIADVKFPDGEIKDKQIIGVFESRDKAVDFCQKNNVSFVDITNHLQQMIEQKKKKANDKEQDSQSPSSEKNRDKGAGIGDE